MIRRADASFAFRVVIMLFGPGHWEKEEEEDFRARIDNI